jgi:hypothetical protein
VYLPKKQRIRLLLLPILAPMFLLGWVLSFIGERGETKQMLKINAHKVTETREDTIQMGLMAELEEDIIEAK